MSYRILDDKRGYEELHKLWSEILKIPIDKLDKVRYVDDKQLALANNIRSIVRGRTKSFKYALLTQLLAKLIEPSVNALAIQKQAKIRGAFDARSFCRKAVVKFEKECLEGVLGKSEDPYVSKPLRHAMISLDVIQHIKDKNAWKKLHHILETIEKTNDENFTRNVLKQTLLETRKLLEEVRTGIAPPIIKLGITALELKEIINEFLSKPSEGARAQAIVYALMRVLNNRLNIFEEIVSTKSTVADEYAKRLADIECFNSKGELKVGIAVTEDLDSRKLREELDKAIERGIGKLMIVANRIKVKHKILHQLVNYYEKKYGIDIIINSLVDFIVFLTTLLNNRMRIDFLEEVRKVLLELGYPEHLTDWAKILKEKGVIQ